MMRVSASNACKTHSFFNFLACTSSFIVLRALGVPLRFVQPQLFVVQSVFFVLVQHSYFYCKACALCVSSLFLFAVEEQSHL